jgi:hypothetical protein
VRRTICSCATVARREAPHFLKRASEAKFGKLPCLVILDRSRDLRLLEHELGDEDGVRITRATPGQVALVAVYQRCNTCRNS